MPRAHAFLFFAALLAACETSATKTVVPDDGGAPAADEAPTDPTVLASPHHARCKLACAAPADGPCSTGQDVAGCITKCTTELDGFSTPCAQCVVEGSGWSGNTCPDRCDPGCPCEIPFGPKPPVKSPCDGFGGDGSSPPPTPTCTAACSGFVLARVSEGTCASICVP